MKDILILLCIATSISSLRSCLPNKEEYINLTDKDLVGSAEFNIVRFKKLYAGKFHNSTGYVTDISDDLVSIRTSVGVTYCSFKYQSNVESLYVGQTINFKGAISEDTTVCNLVMEDCELLATNN